jgi:hypothetical protein
MSGGTQSVGSSDDASSVGVMSSGVGVASVLTDWSGVGLASREGETVGGMGVAVAEAVSSYNGWNGVGVGVAFGGTVTISSALGVAAATWLWLGVTVQAVNRSKRTESNRQRYIALAR